MSKTAHCWLMFVLCWIVTGFFFFPEVVQSAFAPEPLPLERPAPFKSMYAAPEDCEGRQWIRKQADASPPWHECIDMDFRGRI